MARRTAHYVLSTHWDREWYQPFQDYRYRLVQLLDRVIAALEDGRLRGPFVADGQAIMLDDYLEIRTDRREQVERLVREGKIRVGPWYILPDEFLVSGESLIRNIALGRSIARQFGAEPSNAGFLCDLFGHNSQMPQIFAGFGIHGGFVWRGVNLTETSLFNWRGADGTILPCYRFGYEGYCSYAFAVRRADRGGFDPVEGPADLDKYLQGEARRSEVDALLLFDGGDHQEWDEQAYQLIRQRMDEPGEKFAIVHSTLDDYLADMLEQASSIHLQLTGELRDAGRYARPTDHQWVIPGVASSRVWIKQANAECESLLCQWAEPMDMMAGRWAGAAGRKQFLDVAWRWLLRNHPHDSICGCSIDQVHEDMRFRFSQCRQIARRVRLQAAREIAAGIRGEVTDDHQRLVVFNSRPRPVQDVVELTVQVPEDWPQFAEFFGFESKPSFRLYDESGSEVPYQRLEQSMHRTKRRLMPTRFPQGFHTDDVRVAMKVDLPAMGYATFRIAKPAANDPTRHPACPSLVTGDSCMSNGRISVSVNSDGSVNMVDQSTGESYQNLLTLEDAADIGDGWYHGPPVNDQVFTSRAASADVAVVHDGPMQATMRIRQIMRVPCCFDFASHRRNEQLVELVVDNLLTLRRDSDHLDVHTTVHNPARDHRLRVLLPVGVETETYLADTPFDVVRRSIQLPADNHRYRELEIETRPHQNWVAVHDEQRGLALITQGLYESAVRDIPGRCLALTLLRCTGRTVMTDGEDGGQLIGTHEFRYRIKPLCGEPDRTQLFDLAQQLSGGHLAVQMAPADVELYRQTNDLPLRASMLRIDGQAVLTSMRQLDDATELRLFNPTESEQAVKLHVDDSLWGGGVGHWQPVDFEGGPAGEGGTVEKGKPISLKLAPKKIITLQIGSAEE